VIVITVAPPEGLIATLLRPPRHSRGSDAATRWCGARAGSVATRPGVRCQESFAPPRPAGRPSSVAVSPLVSSGRPRGVVGAGPWSNGGGLSPGRAA
jgi:hypothetical protein